MVLYSTIIFNPPKVLASFSSDVLAVVHLGWNIIILGIYCGH